MITREQYSRNQQIIQNRLIKLYVPKVQAALQAQIQDTIHVVKTKGITAAQGNINGSILNKEIGAVITELYTTAANLAIRKYKPNIKAFGPAKWFVQSILAFFQKHLLEKVVLPISQTTIDQVEAVLQDAIANGWGVDKTVHNLEDADLTKFRARLIVRTETVKATNFTQLMAADSEDYEMDKQWISVEDNRTRKTHSHAGVDGERIPIDELYSNGLMFPGDPAGSAKEVCNCFLPDQLTSINPKAIKRIFRNWHKGQIVTIKTSSGKNFTCTINHPILTNNGWVAAGKLTKFDQLVKSESIDALCIEHPDIDNIPTTFEKIYQAFCETGNRSRIPGIIVDFNGDIPAIDVDVISTESKLMDGDQISNFYGINYRLLAYTNYAQCFLLLYGSFCVRSLEKFFWQISNRFVGGLCKFLSILKRGFVHSQIHGIASIQGSNSNRFQSLANDISRNLEMGRNRFNAISAFKQSLNFANIDFSSDRVVENFKACIRYNFPKFIMISADNISDFLYTQSGLSKFDNVIDVVFHDYEGFVFTFETRTQMYDINSFTCRNCRCTQGFFARRDLEGNLIPKKTEHLDLLTRMNLNRQIAS